MLEIIYYRRPRLITCFETLLDELREAGICRLSLAHKMGDVNFSRAVDTARAARLLNDRGVATPAMHGIFRDDYDLNGIDVNYVVGSQRAVLENAATLGVKTYVLHSGVPVEGRSEREELDHVRRALDELLPMAQRFGIVLALENLPPDYVGHRPEDLIDVVTAFDSPNLRICFDSGHAHMCGDAAGYLDVIAPYVVTMHLPDNDGGGDRHLSPGEGSIDWSALRSAIDRCPNLMHVEIESFNREGYSHLELMDLYRRLLA